MQLHPFPAPYARCVWAVLGVLLFTLLGCGGLPAHLDAHASVPAASAPSPAVAVETADVPDGCVRFHGDAALRTAQQPSVRAESAATLALPAVTAGPRTAVRSAGARNRSPGEGRTVLAALCRWRI
ncbi:hypothetical protein [Streptomyces sp. NPDC053542]|uniref:hypothetical protein n=1 Tax=Streptomyces sp. NPDC053542 TaxID=3365710 RepID=UPI0037CDECEB